MAGCCSIARAWLCASAWIRTGSGRNDAVVQGSDPPRLRGARSQARLRRAGAAAHSPRGMRRLLAFHEADEIHPEGHARARLALLNGELGTEPSREELLGLRRAV